MNNHNHWGSIINISLRSFLRRVFRRGPKWCKGLPEGLEREVLNDLCQRHKGASLRKVAFCHLSAWKATGSYRVRLQTVTGGVWHLIFKQANYHLQQVPALENLPVQPGQPEFLVYQNALGSLGDFLPVVYQCEEVTVGKRYHYLLEDLGDRFCLARGPADLATCAQRLPALHSALGRFCEVVDTRELLRFDEGFWEALVEYAAKALEKYGLATGNPRVNQLLEQWSTLTPLRRKMLSNHPGPVPIHGDFNASNILLCANQPNPMKVVDWEWAGIGLCHMDLASLLKGEPEAVERSIVQMFANHDRGVSLAEHWRFYQWCQIERGMLDAAFLSVQQMNAVHSSKLDLRWCVDNSVDFMLRKLREATQ